MYKIKYKIIEKCVDKYTIQCYYNDIKRKQEKNKSNKIKNHSIHSINKRYMKGMKSKRKGKVIPLGH